MTKPAANRTEIVRVIRIIEYIGRRDLVEQQVARSIHGVKDPGNGVRITVATLGLYPEIMDAALQKERIRARRTGDSNG